MWTFSAVRALLHPLLASLLLVACGGDTFHSTGDADSSGGNGDGGGTRDGGATGDGGTKSTGTGGGANSGGSIQGGTGGRGGAGAGGRASGGASGNSSGGSADGGTGGVRSGSGGTSAGGTSASGGKGGKGGGSGGASSTGGHGQGGLATGGAGGGTSCVTSNDCASKEVCAFPMQAGCAATGTCVPAPMAVCQAYSPGCACDGSTINIVCTGLPNGYVSKPLAHTGMCGTTDPKTFTCGTMQCNATSEYCKVSEGGACCNPPSYGCVAFPASCASTPTCACLGTSIAGGQCSEAAAGGVTVTFAYP
jgi:hypothetical protein